MTAEACRPSGYLAICCFAQARFSAVKTKLFGWISAGARRRTLIGPALPRHKPLFLSCAGLTHASRLGGHGRASLMGMAGTSPAMTGRGHGTSSVHLPEHDVERAEDGGDVGQHVAPAHEIHR